MESEQAFGMEAWVEEFLSGMLEITERERLDLQVTEDDGGENPLREVYEVEMREHLTHLALFVLLGEPGGRDRNAVRDIARKLERITSQRWPTLAES